MSKVIILTESELKKLIVRVLNEDSKRGDTNSEVKNVQRLLKGVGYDLGTSGKDGNGIDGNFGGRTETAIKDYQTKKRLQPTGIINSELISSLQSESDREGGPKQYGKGVVTGTQTGKEKTSTNKTATEKGGAVNQDMWVDCITKSPKVKWLTTNDKKTKVAYINGNYFYGNGIARTAGNERGNYFCFKNGIKIVTDKDKNKIYVETGVETNTDPSNTNLLSSIGGGVFKGFKKFIRQTFPNFAQLFSTRAISSQDFTESQKEVIFNVIQNAIKRGKGTRISGCVEYIDYSQKVDSTLNKAGGASTWEMLAGSAISDEFRVATLLGRFCYKMASNGSYYISDKYDFSKWSTFTVKPSEVKGMSKIEKLAYVYKKTNLSPYGVLRHVAWLENPDDAPESLKTPVNVTIEPGLFAKFEKKSGQGLSGQDNTNISSIV